MITTLLAATLALAPSTTPVETRIRLATLAPKDSSVYRVLQEMGEAWKKEGGLKLTIHADATMGGEGDVVKKMRVGQLQAAVLTVTGLRDVDASVTALQSLPLAFRTLDECAKVREDLEPVIRDRMRAQGFELLFLSDVGWVRFFTTKRVETPDDMKKLKLFTWAGDAPQIELTKGLGFDAVPLEPTDVLVGLQTGLVEAVPMVPFFAQIAQVSTKAKYMLDLEWAPLVGGAVMTKKAWDGLDDAQKKIVSESARTAGAEIVRRNRIESDQSIEAMKKGGLVVVPATDEIRATWRAFMEPVYPRLRGTIVPADLYDRVMKKLAALRADAGGTEKR